jgi:uncharacterized membrane protein
MAGFELIVALGIVAVMAYASGWRPSFKLLGPAHSSQTALDVLNVRYIRGEITHEEYQQVRQDLEG